MEIKRIEDYQKQSLELLLSQYKNRYNIEGLIKSKTKFIQELEYAIYAVTYSLLIDNASSNQLDILGKVVGQERGNLGNEAYKLLILGRISSNISRGLPNDIINILSIIDPDAKYSETYPASIRIISGLEFNDSNNWELANTYLRLILNAKPTGVSYEIQDHSYIEPLSAFRLADRELYNGHIENYHGCFCDLDADNSTGVWLQTDFSGLLPNQLVP
jgi:hypothetical protein